VEIIRTRSRGVVAVLSVFSIIVHDLIHLFIIAIVDDRLIVVVTNIENVIDVLICLYLPSRVRDEKVLVANREASYKVPATTKHVLGNIKVCSD
jgi:hypothetical protein